MNDDTTPQTVLFPGLASRPVVARFDQPHGSSDGGLLLLKACDERLGLSSTLAGCLDDPRQPGKIAHSLQDLIRQRLFAIASGYADGNDAARLGGDPLHRLAVGRDPLLGADLASQPTLSRFENGVGRSELLRLGHTLADTVIASHARRRHGRAQRIVIDLDPTDDPTHGQQQLTFFNGHYGTWCYLPLAAFVTFDRERDQQLVGWVLRPGNAPATAGAIGLLRRLIQRLRQAFPKTRLVVRLDGGYATPALFDFLDAQRVGYVVAMGKNPVLERRAEPLMEVARRLADKRGQTTHFYTDDRYQAGSWGRARRVVIKAEVTCLPGRTPRDNPRFVITNLKGPARHVYARVYCARGEIENRLKELLHGLEIDRTSCSTFYANQFRGLLTAAAYALYQQLRLAARGTAFARAQVSTLRDHLVKLGAWVQGSVRRLVIHLPASAPHRQDWQRIARALGAVPG